MSEALHRIAVSGHEPTKDPRGADLAEKLAELTGKTPQVGVADVYTVAGPLTDAELAETGKFLANPAVEQVTVDSAPFDDADWVAEVGFLPGVTDNVGSTARDTIADLVDSKLSGVYTSRQYAVRGKVSAKQVEQAAAEILYNELIQRCRVASGTEAATQPSLFESAPVVTSSHQPAVEAVDLDLEDEALLKLNSQRTLALTLPELKAIRDYFAKPGVIKQRKAAGLEPPPTDVELEALAQTWSEHCKHKIFNATIDYLADGKSKQIKSIFKTFIQASTEKISKQRDWLVSVFTDNAGIIKLLPGHNLVMKVETHNSPSALDPYGGAITGILGCNRDTVGTGKGASLLFNTDVFCFASPFYDQPLPPRLLHPRQIFAGVRQGVEHGGNKMGVPTVNGSVVFDDRFLGKPLVYCGTGGLIPETVGGQPSEEKDIAPGDLAVMCGGRIGKDGIHGATFSSEELHEGSPVAAVQIGDPITQKNLFDFLIEARDLGLFKTLTDNGAGGLSSSIGEMAELSNGCEIDLEKAPLKYPGLDPWEILISESQERMTIVADPKHWDALKALAAKRRVEVSDVGTFTGSGQFHVRYDGKTVGLVDLEFLHHGLPEMKLKAEWVPPKLTEPKIPEPQDYTDELKQLLGRLNVCSKESLVRQYDHEVQGGSVVKPLTGVENDGPSDAGVIRAVAGRPEGVVVSHGIAPRFSDLDTYHMTANVIDEAIRNAVATGADPDHLAGLDNYCWCDPIATDKNPDGEYKLAQLVRSGQALYDYTVAFGVPCISGKDSMKNDYVAADTKISIPPTLLFTVVGKIDDVAKAVTMDAKRAGDAVYVLGETKAELGGSEYYAMHDAVGTAVPEVDAKTAAKRYQAVAAAMKKGLVASAHDCSDGGLAVALTETAFAGGLGLKADLAAAPGAKGLNAAETLFSESASRLVVTVHPDDMVAFEKIVKSTDVSKIGEVTDDGQVTLTHGDRPVVTAPITDLKAAWQRTLGV